MFSLQSDFKRHFLVNLVGGSATPHDHLNLLKLYFVLIQIPQILYSRAQYMLTVRLRRIPSKIGPERLG
jgi:hypothetical protein